MVTNVNANFGQNPFANIIQSSPFSPDPFQNLANFATRSGVAGQAGQITQLQNALAQQNLQLQGNELAQAPLLKSLGQLSSAATSNILPSIAGVGNIITDPNILALQQSFGQKEQLAGIAEQQANAARTVELGGGITRFDPKTGIPTSAFNINEPEAIRVAQAEAQIEQPGKETVVRFERIPDGKGGFTRQEVTRVTNIVGEPPAPSKVGDIDIKIPDGFIKRPNASVEFGEKNGKKFIIINVIDNQTARTRRAIFRDEDGVFIGFTDK